MSQSLSKYLKIAYAVIVIGVGVWLLARANRKKKAIANDRSYLGKTTDESGQALPRGWRNNNVGNIVQNSNPKYIGKVSPNTDGKFEQYESFFTGIRNMIVLLGGYIKNGRNTIRKIMEAYAPVSENAASFDAYIRYVSQSAGIDPDQPLSYNYLTMQAIVIAMTGFENNKKAISRSDFDAAWALV